MKKMKMKKSGFTFIETIIFVSIFSVALGAIVSSILFVYKGQRYNLQVASATYEARKGIEQTIRDLREASYSDIGSYPIISASSSFINFYSDIDKDSKIEQVKYYLDGDKLKKDETEAVGNPPEYKQENTHSMVVAKNVRNNPLSVPLFTFFDKSGNEMTNLSKITDIAFIKMRVIINLDPVHKPDDFEIRSSAALRNIIGNK